MKLNGPIFILVAIITSSCSENTFIDFQNTSAPDLISPSAVRKFAKIYKTPTIEVPSEKWPLFTDDLDFQNMELAIDRQIFRFSNKNLKRLAIELGGHVFSAEKVVQSLEQFKNIVQIHSKCTITSQNKSKCTDKLNVLLKNNFRLFKPKLNANDPGFNKTEYTRFTAYYTPLIEASLSADKLHKHSIYRLPPENLRYLTRTEIDFDQKLRNHNLELFYTKDLFELYLLHVQGGGKIRVYNQGASEEYYISYAGTNRKSWRFISLYMEEQGYIQNRSIEAQREFLENYPDKQKEIYNSCESYVYFKLSNTPPEGSDVVPLTDGRSIATDYRHYAFKGLLSFVIAKRPISASNKKMKKFSRFFLDQDTGGAIKGKARVDIYHGEGNYAETAAYNTDVRGQLYFLISK